MSFFHFYFYIIEATDFSQTRTFKMRILRDYFNIHKESLVVISFLFGVLLKHFFFFLPQRLLQSLVYFLWCNVVLAVETQSPLGALPPVLLPPRWLSHGNKAKPLWLTSFSTLRYKKAANTWESVKSKSRDRTGMQDSLSNASRLMLQGQDRLPSESQVRLMLCHKSLLFSILFWL